MDEFLIKCDSDDWFDLKADQWPTVMHPNTLAFSSVPGWGNHRIEVNGVEIAFSDEMPGIQVIFEGELSDALQRQIVKEVLANIEQATGQQGQIVEI